MSDVRRLFASALPAQGGRVALPDNSMRHARVLRLKPGAPVRLFDGRAREADARIVSFTRAELVCEASPAVAVPVAEPRVHVLLGVSKGVKLEGAVRMLSEMGVFAVHPVVCERSVSRPADAHERVERLARIALEACAQSGQSWAPEVHEVAPLGAAASRAPDDAVRVVFWEDGATDLTAAAARWPSRPREAWIAIGPEGGLSRAEVDLLAAQGYLQVNLGPMRLRVETATPVAVALVLDRLGRLRP
jgi:16S rRNA (uracil1498-N3)-methyltransferase